MTEIICHFGKHKGKELSEIPQGYLNWAVNNINDPRPAAKYQFQEDGKTPLTKAEVDLLEQQMRDWLSAAEDELLNRDPA